MSSSFKERFAQVGPVRELDRVQAGSSVVVALRPGPRLAEVKAVSASLSLARRGIGMGKAKRLVEEAIKTGRALVDLPHVEDAAVLAAELRDSGILVGTMGVSQVSVRSIREQLRLTQEQFALRYGFDLGTLRNWEIGKRKPPTAVASYLKVIERMPDHASAALEDPVSDTSLNTRSSSSRGRSAS